MKIKNIISIIISLSVTVSGIIAVRAGTASKTWDFDKDGGLPEGFSYASGEIDIFNDHAGADGNGAAFGFAAGKGNGRGKGVLDSNSPGMNIYVGDITGSSEFITVDYDFLIQSDNLKSYLLNTPLGAVAKLESNEIIVNGKVIGTVVKDEWYNFGVLLNKVNDEISADIYFDGERVCEGEKLFDGDLNCETLSVLITSLTSAAEYKSQTSYSARGEILQIDNLYISKANDYFVDSFTVKSVSQGSTLNSIVISFNRELAGFSKNDVSISNSDGEACVVDGAAISDNGKNVTIQLKDDLNVGSKYTVKLSELIQCVDGIPFSGDDQMEFSAELPSGINMEWTFDDQNSLPKYFAYTNKNVPVITSRTGRNGDIGDYSFTYLIGIGGGTPSQSEVISKYTNGFSILGGLLSKPVNNTDIAVDMDFSIQNPDMIGYLICPSWGINDGSYDSPVEYYNDGKVYFKGNEVGEWKENEWHNLGVIYHLSSSAASVDVYYDGIKKVDGVILNGAVNKAGIKYFWTCSSSRPSGDIIPGRYDARGEFFTFDNLYIGEDLSRVISSFEIVESTPLPDSTDIPVDTPVSITFNDKIKNDVCDGLFSVTDSSGNETVLNNVELQNDNYTIKAELPGKLKYKEAYELKISDKLISEGGKSIKKTIKFKTESYYENKLTVDDPDISNGIFTAEASLDNDNGTIIAVSLDELGCIKDIARSNEGKMSVKLNSDEKSTIQVFAVDSLSNAKLIADPIVINDNESGYSEITDINIKDEITADKIITVRGNSGVGGTYVLCKIMKSGKTASSDDLDDYISLCVKKSDKDGAFEFSGTANEKEGTYSYLAKFADVSQGGSVDYKINEGNSITKFSVSDFSCTISGKSINVTVPSNTDLSGMLAKFTLSDGAKLYNGNEELKSGQSRINCNGKVELDVISEYGETETYELRVTRQQAVNSGGGGGGGGGSSAGKTAATLISQKPQPVPEAIKDEDLKFTDVDKSFWAYEQIGKLSDKGVLLGFEDGTFMPDRSILREEFAVILNRVFTYKSKNTHIAFDDVKEDEWYSDAVYNLAGSGIINGTDAHIFGTGNEITRADMATMIYRCISDKEYEQVREYVRFADDDEIPEYAREAIEKLYAYGIISGMGENKFDPSGTATRAQIAYIIYSITE